MAATAQSPRHDLLDREALLTYWPDTSRIQREEKGEANERQEKKRKREKRDYEYSVGHEGVMPMLSERED